MLYLRVVDYNAKVQIFEQITTVANHTVVDVMLLIITQRYKFSSKSQPIVNETFLKSVVDYNAKVQIFEQITTGHWIQVPRPRLLIITQRYKFSSKSQPLLVLFTNAFCC